MVKTTLALFLVISQMLYAAGPVIVVLGPPGAGKGTFSQHLKEKYAYNHLSAGDLVRKEIEKKTSIGLQISDIVKRGEYINPKIMQELISQSITEYSRQEKPFIVDGYGRTEPELQFLYQLLQDLDLFKEAFVLFLDASDAVCRERMSHRILCSQCDQVYNSITALPKVEGQCDICFSSLKKRLNDTQEVIEKKLIDYRARIESCYKKSFDFFPHISFETEKDIDSCLEFYDELNNRS